MSQFYLASDEHFMNYGNIAYPTIGSDMQFRRCTANTENEEFGVFIGAGQTFGRFASDPFPNIVSRAIGIPCINLGVGGTGPILYQNHRFLELINKASFCVVQVT